MSSAGTLFHIRLLFGFVLSQDVSQNQQTHPFSPKAGRNIAFKSQVFTTGMSTTPECSGGGPHD